MVIGNTEFNHGIDLLNERIKQSNAAIITANTDLITSGLENVTPYYTIKIDGVNISFLGLTNIEKKTGKPATSSKNVEKIIFYDPIETALKYKDLKKKSNVFVALTHIGINNDRTLADSMPELDLIIGAHSHTLLEDLEIRNGVSITQAERYARSVGKTTILLKKGVVSKIKNEIIDLKNWTKTEPVDPLIIPKIREYEANPIFFTPVLTLKYSIPNCMQLGYMMTDAAVDQLHEAEFSLINGSAIRIDSLSSKTPITLGDIIRLSPFNNQFIIVKVTPAEIIEFLEKRNCDMMPSGFIFETIETKENQKKISKITFPCGKEMDENKLYGLAIDNFLYSNFMEGIETSRTIETDRFVVDIILDFLRKNPDADYQDRPARIKNLTTL
jgi:2',3'-cyclic-nucleotide 2'-phosphodiesterase (5'-nucleotidase family)